MKYVPHEELLLILKVKKFLSWQIYQVPSLFVLAVRNSLNKFILSLFHPGWESSSQHWREKSISLTLLERDRINSENRPVALSAHESADTLLIHWNAFDLLRYPLSHICKILVHLSCENCADDNRMDLHMYNKIVLQGQRFNQVPIFLVLYWPHCFRSPHDARQTLQRACTGLYFLLPRAWVMKKIHGLFPVHRRLPSYRLAISFLRHPRSLEVRAWEHKTKPFCVFSNIVSWIIWLYRWHWLAAVYSNSVLINPYQYHAIKYTPALIPNSWFRSFYRTRFQKRWIDGAKLDDTVFA